jgi:hypothetical protein
MELRNPLTKARADALYLAQGYTREDGFDNATDRVPLGAAASFQAFTVEYAVVLPVSGRTQAGRITVAHAGGAPEVTEHAYSFAEPEIAGLTFGADLNAGIVRLVFSKIGVGENPTLFYRVGTVPVVA